MNILEKLADEERQQRLAAISRRLAQRRLRELEQSDDLPLPTTPTGYQCGSREKIDIMRLRAEAGEQVFHPLDAIDLVPENYDSQVSSDRKLDKIELRN